MHPPDGPCNSDPDSRWYQTTTIDGGLQLLASVEEGADGTGAPGEQLWEPPNIRTAYWFGFVCAPQPFANAGHRRDHRHGPQLGGVGALHRRHVQRSGREPVRRALRRVDRPDGLRRPGDAAGNFDIQNVPAGDYNLAIWDEQLSYIMRFKPVHVDAGPDRRRQRDRRRRQRRRRRLALVRLAGRLRLQGRERQRASTTPASTRRSRTPTWTSAGATARSRRRTFTDPNGYYEYPTAEGGALGRWIINEQGFARFSAYPGRVGARRAHRRGDAVLRGRLRRSGQPVHPERRGRRPADEPAPARRPPRHGGLGQARLSRRHARPDRRHHLLRHDPQRVRRALPGARGLRAGHPGRDRVPGDARARTALPNTADDVDREQVRHRPLAAAERQPGPAGRTATRSPRTATRSGTSPAATSPRQFNPDIGPNCLEVPLGGAADQGRRLRRRLRLRRLLPERLRHGCR